MKTGIVIQARMGSTRLPGKVLMPITAQANVLDWVIARVRQNRVIAKIILATTTLSQDDVLEAYAAAHELELCRGSEQDVLARYIGAGEEFALDALVRITADCPLIEPDLVERVIEMGWQSGADYVSTEDYPRGSGDIEFVTMPALRAADAAAGTEKFYREHVTSYIVNHPREFRVLLSRPPNDLQSEARLTVDELADLEMVRRICEHFAPRMDFHLDEIVKYLDTHPEISEINQHVQQKVQ